MTYCTDDGAGLLYRRTTMVEAVTERATGNGYLVRRDDDTNLVVEEVLDTRRL
jgi:hypothetical protein